MTECNSVWPQILSGGAVAIFAGFIAHVLSRWRDSRGEKRIALAKIFVLVGQIQEELESWNNFIKVNTPTGTGLNYNISVEDLNYAGLPRSTSTALNGELEQLVSFYFPQLKKVDSELFKMTSSIVNIYRDLVQLNQAEKLERHQLTGLSNAIHGAMGQCERFKTEILELKANTWF